MSQLSGKEALLSIGGWQHAASTDTKIETLRTATPQNLRTVSRALRSMAWIYQRRWTRSKVK